MIVRACLFCQCLAVNVNKPTNVVRCYWPRAFNLRTEMKATINLPRVAKTDAVGRDRTSAFKRILSCASSRIAASMSQKKQDAAKCVWSCTAALRRRCAAMWPIVHLLQRRRQINRGESLSVAEKPRDSPCQ